ncbi:Copia-like polyprotein/retrotransposon, putative, partial [Medicago truncatula]
MAHGESDIDYDPILLMATKNSGLGSTDGWYLDTGRSSHDSRTIPDKSVDDLDQNIMVWVYQLKDKDEVFQMLKNFKVIVEKRAKRQMKVLGSDGGGECTSNEFESFCTEMG